MPCPCRAHGVPLSCLAAKGLECVFPIWFTQCCRVWFTLAVPCPCHAPTMPFFSRPQHSTAVSRRPHCVNQMGKTHSKLLAARHGRATAWARHAMCESALRLIITTYKTFVSLCPPVLSHNRPNVKSYGSLIYLILLTCVCLLRSSSGNMRQAVAHLVESLR